MSSNIHAGDDSTDLADCLYTSVPLEVPSGDWTTPPDDMGAGLGGRRSTGSELWWEEPWEPSELDRERGDWQEGLGVSAGPAGNTPGGVAAIPAAALLTVSPPTREEGPTQWQRGEPLVHPVGVAISEGDSLETLGSRGAMVARSVPLFPVSGWEQDGTRREVCILPTERASSPSSRPASAQSKEGPPTTASLSPEMVQDTLGWMDIPAESSEGGVEGPCTVPAEQLPVIPSLIFQSRPCHDGPVVQDDVSGRPLAVASDMRPVRQGSGVQGDRCEGGDLGTISSGGRCVQTAPQNLIPVGEAQVEGGVRLDVGGTMLPGGDEIEDLKKVRSAYSVGVVWWGRVYLSWGWEEAKGMGGWM